MKRYFLLILFFPLIAYSQKDIAYIYFRGEMIDTTNRPHSINQNHFKDWYWVINSDTIKTRLDTIVIKINLNEFDTITFVKKGESPRIIITKLESKQNYIIYWNACCNDFDIENAKVLVKLKKLNERKRIENKRNDGQVQFRLLNYNNNDTIAGLFGDIFGGFSGGIILNKEAISKSITPWRAGYSSYIYKISFAKITENRDTINFDESKIHIYIKNPEGQDIRKEYILVNQLSTIEYRFFNKETLIATLDGSNLTMTMNEK